MIPVPDLPSCIVFPLTIEIFNSRQVHGISQEKITGIGSLLEPTSVPKKQDIDLSISIPTYSLQQVLPKVSFLRINPLSLIYCFDRDSSTVLLVNFPKIKNSLFSEKNN
jgi:hypothetical protein